MRTKGVKIRKEKRGAEGRLNPKKILLIVAAICAGLLLLMFGVILLVRAITKEPEPEPVNYHFSPIDETEDIFQDQIYMSLDRSFYYENVNEGITVSFTEDNLSEIPEEYVLPISLLLRYIDYAIHGQTEELNALCSEKFIKSGFSLKDDFTQQKIYETKFSFYRMDTVEEELGTWQRWQFWVEYKIRQNNGTFRNDMGSDCTRKELFEITYRDGKVEIDVIAPYRVQ